MQVKINPVNEDKLTTIQKEHLKVARQIAAPLPLIVADISNTAHIIGAYKIPSGPLFIAPERLNQLRHSINTTVHEKAHHISQANDNTKAHNQAISKLSDKVAQDAKAGRFDHLLGGVRW